MKKFISLVLAFCFIIGASVSSFALKMNEISDEATISSVDAFRDNFVTQEQIESSRAEIKRLYQIGLSTGNGAKGRITLNVSLLLQDDPDWEDEHFPCNENLPAHANHTYGVMGCAMTSYAMVLNYYGGDYTPVDVAENYGTSACNFNSTTLLSYYGRSGASSSCANTSSAYVSAKIAIKGAIIESKPSVIRLVSPNGGYHFVVGYGYRDNGTSVNIYIRDPESDYAYTTLDQYYNAGFHPDKYVVVS